MVISVYSNMRTGRRINVPFCVYTRYNKSHKLYISINISILRIVSNRSNAISSKCFQFLMAEFK